MLHSALYIKKIPKKGRAIFTQQKIPANSIIEIAPVIVMGKKDRPLLDKTLLHDYIFEWGKKSDKCAMALGYIPIYNHSYSSNCEYFMDFEEDIIFVKTIRDIKKEEELTINYNGTWNNTKKVWFDTVDK